MTKHFLAWLLLCAGTPALHAADGLTAASGLAFPSVQEGASARAIALGSTYVGIAQASAALLWNPAGLCGLEGSEFALHHNAALVGAIQEIAVLGLPLGSGNGMGLSLTYEDQGSFEGRDAGGMKTGELSARAYGASLGWGSGSPDGLSLGLALKLNRQDLAGASYQAFAADFGLLWALSPGVAVGAAYTNLGPEVQGRQLAQGLRIGISSSHFLDEQRDHEWLLAASGEAITRGDNSLHLGIEYTFVRTLSLRGGYGVGLPNPGEPGPGWSCGAGVKLKALSVDYAFVPLADLGSMQRLSLTYAP